MMRLWFRAVFLSVAASAFARSDASTGEILRQESFDLSESAEVIATITAACDGCDWGRAGREALVVRLEVDGRYSQHLFLTRGSSSADYRVLLGSFPAGRHRLTLARDRTASAASAKNALISRVDIVPLPASHPEHEATSLAPILYARPNTLGRFTDIPLLLWYETEKTDRGSRIRYSMIFSNEDGGTPADRLLATWGRLTDIEYIYGIEFDRTGGIIEETFQGKDHQIVPFRGRREGRHPLLYVVTDNNMVKDEGNARQRYAPAPIPFDLSEASREEVMDANPWTYVVTAQEARREGRVAKAPLPGSKLIFDPSRYAVIEACASPDDAPYATFAFGVGVSEAGGEPRFLDSTLGVRDFRISRSADNFPNGCFRGAVALPQGVKAENVTALRVRAYTRPPRKGERPPAKRSGPARLRRVNRLFLMSPLDLPEPSLFAWTGDVALVLDGEPATLEIRPPRR